MTATVTSRGQITIPLAIRRKPRLRQGTVLEFDEAADHLRATRGVDLARMRSVIGIAKSELAGRSGREWMDELRDRFLAAARAAIRDAPSPLSSPSARRSAWRR